MSQPAALFKLLAFLLYVTLVSMTCGPEQTILNEGTKLCCYKDTKNKPTIGIGFNLRRSDASVVMARYNLTLSNVLYDCKRKKKFSCLTQSQAEDIFYTLSYPEAESCVDRFVPNLPTQKRAALVDIAFAGCGTLNKFKSLKKALLKNDWQQAGEEVQNSKWCSQVQEQRCSSDYNCIAEGGCLGQYCGAFTPDCSSNPDCWCFKTTNGSGFCALSEYCSNLADCTSCPSSTSVCVIDSCCVSPICIPLSYGATCQSPPNKHSLLNSQKFDIKKQPHGTTVRI